jgi:cell shape-determining protein MreD
MFHVKRLRILCHTSATDVASINRLSPILAIAVGVIHAGLAPILAAAQVTPNLAVVSVVLATVYAGPRAGATWAFIVGVTANTIGTQPLGSIPLALLAAAAVVAVASPLAPSIGPAYTVAATFVASMAFDAVLLAVLSVLGDGPGWSAALVTPILGGAAMNAVLTALVLLVVWIARARGRPGRGERLARWPA